MSMISDLRGRAERAVAYRRTLRELSAINETVARDLDIAPYQVPQIAREAVYAR